MDLFKPMDNAGDASSEKKELEVKEHRLLSLEEKEKELYNRIQSMVELSKEIEKKLQSEKTGITTAEDRVLNLQKSVKEIEKHISLVSENMKILPYLRKSNLKIMLDLVSYSSEELNR